MMGRNISIIKHKRPEFTLEMPPALQERPLVQKQLTLADLLSTLNKRKWTILGFAAVVFALSSAYTFTRTPMYEGVARLQIDPSRSTSLGLDDADKSEPGEVDGRVKTEIEIIQSNTVAGQVIDSLKLFANPKFAGTDTAGTETSEISQLGPAQRQRLLDSFRNDLTVKVIPNTAVVEIRFKSRDAGLASTVVNSVIDEYRKRNFITRVDGTNQVSLWLNRQLEEIRQSTTDAQQKLATFQRDNNILGTDESDNIVTDRLKQLNEELTQAEAERIVKEGRYRLARTGNPELIDAPLSSGTLQVLRNQQTELQAQYSQLNAKFGSGYPKVHELHSQLEQLDGQIKAEGLNVRQRLANEYDTAARSEWMIRNDFEHQKQQAYKLNEHVSQYAILKHEVESGQKLYDTLELKLKSAGIASGLTSSYVNVIDRAQLPVSPIEPRKSLYLALGLGGGLFGGLLLGLLQDSLDNTLRTSEELEGASALPELASIPFIQTLADKKSKDLSRARPLTPERAAFVHLAFRQPYGPGIEAYRSLCSVVLLASAETSAKVLVVASATAGEGKSTVSCNLATALAQRGRKVLLVDADLRCSSFDSPSSAGPGLSTMCAAGAAHHPRYQPLVDIPNLHVVPAGIRPTDPTRVLDSSRMQDLITVWRTEYDHIILDTPPVLPFADALSLASKSDGVILVARSGITQSKAILRARDLLLRSGANLLGFVMNGVKERESYYAYPAAYQHVLQNGQHENF
jgi:polysaccharide biosynthesis transport protein